MFPENNSDRRASTRFPIEREIRYRFLTGNHPNGEGGGTSVNISSSGILFATDNHLQPGTSIEVTVSWPVLRDADVSLRLVVLGRVVRAGGGTAAIEFQRHELRIEGVPSGDMQSLA